MINVREFGVFGDGRDYTAALRAAMLTPNALLYFPTGEYVITGPLLLHPTASIVGDGSSLSKIILRDDGFTGGGIASYGELPEKVATGVSVTKNSSLTPVAVTPKSVVIAFDPTPSSYSTHRSYYHNGQFSQALSTTEIVGQWIESFGPATELYELRNPSRSCFTGISIIREGVESSSAFSCLEILFGVGNKLDDVFITGSVYSLARLRSCYRTNITRCEMLQFGADTQSNGTNYGLVIANCQDVRVNNSTFVGLRHGVTTGGGSYAQGYPNPPNRCISIDSCDITSTYNVAALDFHGNTDEYRVTNCRIIGGLDLGGNNSVIAGNTIRGRNETQAGVAIYASELTGCDHIIENNDITGIVTSSYNERAAVYLNLFPKTIRGGTTTVRNNRINVEGALSTVKGIRAENYGSQAPWRLDIQGNRLTASTGPSVMIRIARTAEAAKFVGPVTDLSRNYIDGTTQVKAADFTG